MSDKYLNETGLQRVADKVNTRLKTVSVMPSAAKEDATRLYIGASTAEFTKGHTYQAHNTDYFAWQYGTEPDPIVICFTESETPEIGDNVYNNSFEVLGTITSVGTGTIEYDGNTFDRNTEEDIVKLTWVDISPAGGSGGGSLEDTLTASVSVGGISSGNSYSAGTFLETIFRDMLDPVQNPTFTNPSVSLAANPTGTLLEVGATKTVTLTATFNRGTITPAYGTSGYRSGPATDYTLNGGTPQAGNSWSDIIVDETNKSFSAVVNYSAGEQPKNSKGEDYDTPLAAGSVSTSTMTYEFVNALWANTSDITSVAKLPLISKSAKLKEFNFPAATVANPEVFEVPASWTITAVEYYDEVFTHAWSDCSSEFTITDTTEKDAANVDTAYKRYTCNLGVDMGARKIRIKWN